MYANLIKITFRSVVENKCDVPQEKGASRKIPKLFWDTCGKVVGKLWESCGKVAGKVAGTCGKVAGNLTGPCGKKLWGVAGRCGIQEIRICKMKLFWLIVKELLYFMFGFVSFS